MELETIIEIIGKISIGILVAACSAFITVKLSLKKFHAEKWWEKKVEAYQSIIEALHQVKQFSSHHFKAGFLDKDVTPEKDAELRENSRVGQQEIKKVMDIGGLIISDSALAVLEQYKKDVCAANKEKTWMEHLDADLAATDKCIKDFIAVSKQDLGVK